MRRVTPIVVIAMVSVILLGSTFGCTAGRFTMPFPNSHFDYPNSNITPLGRVTGESSTVSLFFPVMQDADIQEEAYTSALAQKRGDLLIDGLATTKITLYPLMFINVFVTTYKVEGIAAKMDLGKQILR